MTNDSAQPIHHWQWSSLAAWLLLSLPGLTSAQTPPACPINLVDVTRDTGIDFVHNHGGRNQGYIVEGMSTGIATLDYDNDGFVDIYFLNGAPLKGTTVAAPLRNRLYRNRGDWTFEDVTEAAGVGDEGYALGVAVADYDGDGYQDIYVNNFGVNVLYRNLGDKTFADVTQAAGVGNGNRVGAGAAFLDIERDGDLDLYVANYVDFSYSNHVPIVIDGVQYQAGPQYYDSVPDTLFRNDGQGKFVDITHEAGIDAVAGPGMGLVCADLDNDHDTDIYVCNDGQPNHLWLNHGDGKFEESAVLTGAAYDFLGKANSSMGVDCADFDQDGLLDLFVTAYQAEMPVLYRNLGGLFEDATNSARITPQLYPHVNWGTAFVDFDNDGDRDLFIACGHFDRVEQIDDRTSQKMHNYVLMNHDGKFVDVSEQCGVGMRVAESSRGAALEDFDNDGYMDVVIVNSGGAPTLLRNAAQTSHHWVQFDLEQDGLNRDAIGARVSLGEGETLQIAEVMSGRGYQSHFGKRLHFGLGPSAADFVTVHVRWPDGGESDHQVEVDTISTIKR